LLELIIACAILLILSSMALPLARFTVVRERRKNCGWIAGDAAGDRQV